MKSLNEGRKKSKDPGKNKKFRKVMGEFGKGTLKSSAGKKVTNVDQARAIAYSEAGLSKESVKENNNRAKFVNENFNEDENWTLHVGDKVIFNLKDMEGEWEEANEEDYNTAINHNNSHAIITSQETYTELGDRDYEYYNIKFEDGSELYAVSGYHLDNYTEDLNESAERKLNMIINIDSMSTEDFAQLENWNNSGRIYAEPFEDYYSIEYNESDTEVQDMLEQYLVDPEQYDPYMK